MNTAAARARQGSRRSRVLRAVGITPWRLRQPAVAEAVHGTVAEDAASPSSTACAVVLPAGCAAPALDLVGRALNAYGVELARAGRVQVGADGALLGAVPQTRAYLVFGQAQAHALGRELPAAVMHQAQIVLVDEPARIHAEGAAKRRLWSALRQLRRALATPAVS